MQSVINSCNQEKNALFHLQIVMDAYDNQHEINRNQQVNSSEIIVELVNKGYVILLLKWIGSDADP